MKPKILLLASGDGSLFQAVVDAANVGEIEAHILGLVCDRPSAPVLDRAKKSGIATYLVPFDSARETWNQKMMEVVTSLKPDLIVSAGFMRILAPEFVENFKVINSHPSLLPKFPGAHAVKDALDAQEAMTGTTIHWVDSGVDTGEIIAQVQVAILPSDDIATLHERIKIVERRLIVETIARLLLTLEKRYV
jgi:phosphoribosylglycinamide formyltransferase-1